MEVTDAAESIISGVGLSFPKLPRSVNPRCRAVMESESPKLPSHEEPLFQYDSPPSSSSRRRSRSKSPTIEEMEKSLEINLDSPSLMFNVTSQDPGTVVKKSSRKSSRRTTLVGSDLSKTRKETQTFSFSNRQKSVRAASRGVFYGSPSQRAEKVGETEEQEDSQELRHPLLDQQRRMDPAKQERHNRTILDLINNGTVKHLSLRLPAVGLKTALLIHQHRELHGLYENLGKLQEIPGINKNFFKKFCSQNQIEETHEEC